MSTDLTDTPFDPELIPGAHNAVYVCLRVHKSEKVTLITDLACKEIAASLAAELDTCGCRYRSFILENLAPRPLTHMPEVIWDDLRSSQVSIFAAQAQPNELKARMQMCNVVNENKLRHAHMVNIEKKIMLEGMRADYAEVDKLTARVKNIVKGAKFIRATTPSGTDVRAELSPDYKWISTSGIIRPEKWGAELTPASVAAIAAKSAA
jgi:aminopeptidase